MHTWGNKIIQLIITIKFHVHVTSFCNERRSRILTNNAKRIFINETVQK